MRSNYLGHGVRSADLDDVSHALLAGREILGRLAPILILFVVDNVIRSELLEGFGLLLRGSGRDDRGAGGLGELRKYQKPSSVLMDTLSARRTCTAKMLTPPVP